MARPARRRVLSAGPAASVDFWLIACALVGLACHWIAGIDVPQRLWSADLAVGRGLPMLADPLGPAAARRLLQDVEDPMALVAAGAVPVAVDASPDGVRILYRAEAAEAVTVLVGTLRSRWPEARVWILRHVADPERLLPPLIALLALNAAALVVFARLRRLQAGDWWRWLALQGALSPDLLMGLLVRQGLAAAILGGVGLVAGFGLPALIDLGLPMLLLALAGTGIGLLASLACGWARVLLWTLPQLLLIPLLYGPAVVEDLSMRGSWWGAAASVIVLVVLAAVALRHRLRGWSHGALPA